MDFPNDLLVKIIARVVQGGMHTLERTKLVAKRFRLLCETKEVLSQLSIQDLSLFPWDGNNKSFNDFMAKISDANNPTALYKLGVTKYLVYNSKEEGLALLSLAIREGSQEARLAYGTILVCLGEELIKEGYSILSSLLKPTLVLSMNYVRSIRESGFHGHNLLRMRGYNILKTLKETYVLASCTCDDSFKSYIAFFMDKKYGMDMPMSASCKGCFWKYHLQFIFP